MKYFSIILFSVIFLMFSCQKKRETVAILDGKEIILTDVDKIINKQLFQLVEGVYILRKDALENLLREKIIEQEAKKNCLSVDQLLDKKVFSRLTDSLLEQKAKELNWIISDRSDPFRAYSIKTPFGKVYFKESLALLYKRNFADSLMSFHKIKILLSPPDQIRPNVDLSDIAIHYEGKLNSKNTIVLIGNPDCEGCRKLNPIIDSLYKKYSGSVKFGYAYFDNLVSLSSIALEGAICQNKFSNMQRILYKSPMQPDTLQLLQLAVKINMDTARLHQFLRNKKSFKKIEENIFKIQKKGIYNTPVLIINNLLFSAPFQYDELDNYLAKLID
jgi:thiol-disulfide isomerase/thioredoxin